MVKPIRRQPGAAPVRPPALCATMGVPSCDLALNSHPGTVDFAVHRWLQLNAVGKFSLYIKQSRCTGRKCKIFGHNGHGSLTSLLPKLHSTRLADW